jgi:drug/metabolite transporter (DMT)-like permease
MVDAGTASMIVSAGPVLVTVLACLAGTVIIRARQPGWSRRAG